MLKRLLAAAILAIVLVPAAGAAASDDVSLTISQQATVSAADPAPTGRVEIEVALGQRLEYGLIQLSLPAEQAGQLQDPELRLADAPDRAINDGEAVLDVCLVTQAWTAANASSERPAYDCSVSAPVMHGGTATQAWSVNIQPFLAAWREHPNFGMAIVPSPSVPVTELWRVSFMAAATTATAILGETSPTVPSPPSSGPAALTNRAVSAGPAAMPSAADTSPWAGHDAQPAPVSATSTPLTAAPPDSVSTVRTPQALVQPAYAGSVTQPHGRGGRSWRIWVLALAGLASLSITQFHRLTQGRAGAGVVKLRLWFRPGWESMSPHRAVFAVVGLGSVLLAWAALGALLPAGLPAGVVVLGLILGGLNGLIAIGLVLIYRVARVINFAQAEMGALGATIALVLVVAAHLSYLLAVPIAVVSSMAIGWLIDAQVMRRLQRAPRVILTVATIGIAQNLAAGELGLPALVHTNLTGGFTPPLHWHWRVSPVNFNGADLLPLIIVPLVVAALVAFLRGTDFGRAVRGVADSDERALLCGIPVRRVSSLTWVISSALAAIGGILTMSISGPDPGAAAGPTALLVPLAAAVIGGMESLPVTMGAALAIGVLQQGVFWSYPKSAALDAVLFGIVAVALLARRQMSGRISDPGLGQFAAVEEIRPLASAIQALPVFRLLRSAMLPLGAVVIALPWLLSEANTIIATYIVIFALLGISLVVLSGWAGQVSFGQFAFAGIGGAMCALSMGAHNIDLFASLGFAGVVAAVVAVVVGLPSLRMSGQFLGVATLAFAVPVSTYLLNSTYFPALNPIEIARPLLFNRISLDSSRSYYLFCLFWLAAAWLVARNVRRSRFGRALVATRDNERATASWSIAPARIKLSAFAISGFLAGIGGALYVVGLRGVPYSGFSPVASLQLFTLVVVGGLGSPVGAVLGALYVGLVEHLLHGYAQLLATGSGLLLLLVVFPAGLGGLVFHGRDALARWAARRHGVAALALYDDDLSDEIAALSPPTQPPPAEPLSSQPGLLAWKGLDAGYGKLQVLFSVDGAVQDGEMLALLGTNGAGKSTLLKVLSGILRPDRGQVIFDGEDITGLSPADRLRRGIVTVPGGRGVFPSLSVADNLRLGMWVNRRDRDHRQDSIDRVFEAFPRLAERKNELAGKLSGGEQQMLTLAQALLVRPKLLLIDELSLGLAPKVIEELLEILETLNLNGVTVVLVEQSLNTAARIARRGLFMERGRVKFDGPVTELLRQPDLARAIFLTPASSSPVGSRRQAEGPEPVLEIYDVRKNFGGVVALAGVDLAVNKGEVLALIGPNGSGKTTLLDVCTGFIRPDNGTVMFGGSDVTGMQAYDRADLGLGRVFQDARLVPSLTVADTVAVALERSVEVREPIACALGLAATRKSEEAVAERVGALLDEFGLSPYAERFVSELSTGMRRIVELTCAVAHQPDLLLLDEPSAGVAQREAEALTRVLRQLNQERGMTLMLVEHDLPLVSEVADRVVCLNLGRVLSTGKPAAVLEDPNVLEAYFGVRPGTPRRVKRRRAPRSITAPAPS